VKEISFSKTSFETKRINTGFSLLFYGERAFSFFRDRRSFGEETPQRRVFGDTFYEKVSPAKTASNI
jgi:hypothetical protein